MMKKMMTQYMVREERGREGREVEREGESEGGKNASMY